MFDASLLLAQIQCLKVEWSSLLGFGGALREQTFQVRFLSHFTPLESLMEESGHA